MLPAHPTPSPPSLSSRATCLALLQARVVSLLPSSSLLIALASAILATTLSLVVTLLLELLLAPFLLRALHRSRVVRLISEHFFLNQ